ncbi:MAG TPA: hypothetical protein PLT64_04820 [Syntrophales bacterium]|nr:hypothetical protein [Syntrophales bacterium]HOL59175.1 hypothetical protein [Syntrophales bacterium]HPO35744.1 hypothetical protein [Syntrophales bacterium]
MEERLGVIIVLVTDRERQAREVNQILCDYGDFILGRMGLAQAPGNRHLIVLICHAAEQKVRELTDKLCALAGVAVKYMFL